MSDTHKAIEAVWKIESTRLIAGIARVTRDIGSAEELAQDALVAALERWPDEGIPEKPAAWLMTAAKRAAFARGASAPNDSPPVCDERKARRGVTEDCLARSVSERGATSAASRS